jgi:hypothetical protein
MSDLNRIAIQSAPESTHAGVINDRFSAHTKLTALLKSGSDLYRLSLFCNLAKILATHMLWVSVNDPAAHSLTLSFMMEAG